MSTGIVYFSDKNATYIHTYINLHQAVFIALFDDTCFLHEYRCITTCITTPPNNWAHMNTDTLIFSRWWSRFWKTVSKQSLSALTSEYITALMAQSDKDIYKLSDLSNTWPPAQGFWWNEAIFVDVREYERNRRRRRIERLCFGCLETLLTVKQAACTHTLIN